MNANNSFSLVGNLCKDADVVNFEKADLVRFGIFINAQKKEGEEKTPSAIFNVEKIITERQLQDVNAMTAVARAIRTDVRNAIADQILDHPPDHFHTVIAQPGFDPDWLDPDVDPVVPVEIPKPKPEPVSPEFGSW